MRTLQEMWDSLVEEYLSPHRLGAILIHEHFKAKGVTLTDVQLSDIETKLLNQDISTITLDIEDNQLPPDALKSGEDTRELLSVDLSGSEQDVEQLVSQLTQTLSEAIPEVVETATGLILKRLKQDADSAALAHEKERLSFEARLGNDWHEPLALLDIFLTVAVEVGDRFNRQFRAAESMPDQYMFEAVTRLHARACQIASEILVLLRSGYADGAHARWRSLHEIAVVGTFIAASGDQIAERYLLHDAVESYKAARQYQEYHKRLGYEPLSDSEFRQIETAYRNVVDRFGSDYRESYGWAQSVTAKKRPTFRDIEEAVGLDHLRPFYKMASHNVHADPKGVFFRLGLWPQADDVLLAGPSNVGLADPGQGVALSLAQITVTLLKTDANLDRLVACNILMTLVGEIGEKLLVVQNQLEARAVDKTSQPDDR